MMDIKEHIAGKLKAILTELKFEGVPEIKISDNPEHGDYYTNLAMRLAKQSGKNPLEIAEELKLKIENLKLKILDRVEAVKPGFINFWVSEKYLLENLSSIVDKKEEFGKGSLFTSKKVMVEFTDPNPLKEFHIGHLYSNAVGESLARLFESQSAEVWRVCYQGDVGLHVAKALYGILNHSEGIKSFEDKPLSVRAKFLGETYAEGAKAYENDEDAKKEIESLNKKVYEKDASIFPLYEIAKGWSLEYFETIYQKLGTKFKRYYFESEAGVVGLKIVKQHIGDIFAEDKGSVIFPKEKSGLHTRVFVNSLGLPTYEAKELGLAPTKYKDFPYDLSVIVTGNEINEYFKVLLKALSLIEPSLAAKTKHISHGMVRLPSGKMSSRTGDIIAGDALIDEVENRIQKSYPDVTKEVISKIAVCAVKYALLKSNIGGDITFSFEESINLNGNSGPYLQYTYVRTQSVLGKAKNNNFQFSILNFQLNEEELNVLRLLSIYQQIALEAAEKYSPNLVANYLFELSQKFNLFYQKHSILTPEEGKEIRDFRLSLTSAVGQVLKNGLQLLGIETVEKM
ncbi:MAG: arginine--tRNA ligase [Candidatus Levybacteria bacterium CG_4_10_14_0_2_um_filter_36_16]|nr:MAG: arginine--tRNA ligase [Candidatus Levybacteria bacterium CG_4_10_14_0_2_um_filter_36_16]